MISIVVPVYNAEKYLADCLDSIVNQTFQEWEAIMVNDGSSDQSVEICKKYCEKDTRFHLFEQCNKGVSAARNKGMELCKGEYVFFMDADDTILNNTLSDLYDVINKTNSDIVSFQYQKIQHQEDIAEQLLPDEYQLLSREQALKLFLDERLIGISMCTKLVRHSIIEGIQFEVGRASNEDKYFLFNALLSAKRIVVLQTRYYCYWTRENSATTRTFDARWFDGYYFAKKIYGYICEKMSELEPDARYQLLSSCYFLIRQMDNQKVNTNYVKEYKMIRKEIQKLRVSDILNIISPQRRKGIILIKYAPWLYSFAKMLM